MMKNLRFLAILGMLGLFISGCDTLNNIKNDVTSWIEGDPEQPLPPDSMRASSQCPSIQLVEDLRTYVEFSNSADANQAQEVSRAEILSVNPNCEQGDGYLWVKMDIAMRSQLGPKAKVTQNDSPSFAYPYFVAVTDPDNNILAKEIFAASVSFDSQQQSVQQIETINQQLPMKTQSGNVAYNILIGFQLDDTQLAYNRWQLQTPAQPMPVTGGF